MTRREVHRAVDRLIDLITRPGISEEETAEIEAILDLLRRQRQKVESLPHCPHCVTEAQARTIAFEEGLDFESLPSETKEDLLDAARFAIWAENKQGLSESPFPPLDDDTSSLREPFNRNRYQKRLTRSRGPCEYDARVHDSSV